MTGLFQKIEKLCRQYLKDGPDKELDDLCKSFAAETSMDVWDCKGWESSYTECELELVRKDSRLRYEIDFDSRRGLSFVAFRKLFDGRVECNAGEPIEGSRLDAADFVVGFYETADEYLTGAEFGLLKRPEGAGVLWCMPWRWRDDFEAPAPGKWYEAGRSFFLSHAADIKSELHRRHADYFALLDGLTQK